jgi:aspartate carbamoyltransferase catalytic subunit
MGKRVIKEDFRRRDIVSIEDFSTEEINYILEHAEKVEKNPMEFANSMTGKIMVPLFFENSTRTVGSFQIAMLKMNGKVLDFDVDRSSIQKGETLKDTVKTIEAYEPDIIVVRHSDDGTARFIADVVDIPVINAGDGKNQHPTQTLLDLYSIKQIRKSLDNVNIAIAGDLKYGRTPHSLALALARYENCKISFVSPEYLKMPRDLLKKLKEKRVNFEEYGLEELEKVINQTELVYMTRVQRERFPEGPEGDFEYKKVSRQYCLTLDMLKNVKPEFRIMHPLPKVTEIDPKIDDTKYAYFFKQAKNGVYIRKALLDLICQN